ncbi:23S rRNA (guanosine(2251)-2'-O)-methyltransferase RlmB [Candidatus Anaplasma sp. TIGMIC]|uniref:23S rRNA (guanosine(2251)-2'-O)-methyltransferase RlmB n=1 Tax=Candidatus Anaplasma sp. TIGMIC TaxID=3020713 RepID=UPI00232BBF0C|nr:23S rRNA (guanosine(2251)-2'-O)-methyltransferase RlmB [Candidatus Anaplasma sp. TIGMIC]MDB1135213.1 23S rRNA (guanosine(2251)-2'-O)-methyltransferase RlmB [Candidatus Anaplasma sp. TIGMIC]
MNRSKKDGQYVWIYGRHACIAALKNPNRICAEVLLAQGQTQKNGSISTLARSRRVPVREVDISKLDTALGYKASHQGVLLRAVPLFGRYGSSTTRIEDIVSCANASATSTILILDEVTDVNNVGAILRSAACFNVDAVVLPAHNSPSESCGMAKVSSGATDVVPVVSVVNLVKTLEYLKHEGYWCYGLDSAEGQSLHATKFSARRVVVLGAEGKGMRQLTRKHCDYLVNIPMSEKMESLNVSNAAAIAMYSMFLQKE